MRRAIWLVPVILLLCVTTKAQQTPAWEFSGGYSHMIANVSGKSFNLDGGEGSVDENINNWFGGRLEVNAWGGNVAGTRVTAQTFTYGPVFTYRKMDRFTPFAHFQIGAIHASQGYLGISESAFKFAIVPGGGVDVAVSPSLAIRAQGDYLASYFLNSRQNNFQFSIGLVFRYGSKK